VKECGYGLHGQWNNSDVMSTLRFILEVGVSTEREMLGIIKNGQGDKLF
jgi:hypothetical protein